MIRRFPTESQSSARARRRGRAANDDAFFVFCFSSPRLGARPPPFARDAPLPLNPLFVFVGDGGMKGWRHLWVDQEIPPRDENETGVYDGRHIFLCGFRLFSKKTHRRLPRPPRPSPHTGDEQHSMRSFERVHLAAIAAVRSRCKAFILGSLWKRSGVPSRRNALRAFHLSTRVETSLTSSRHRVRPARGAGSRPSPCRRRRPET